MIRDIKFSLLSIMLTFFWNTFCPICRAEHTIFPNFLWCTLYNMHLGTYFSSEDCNTKFREVLKLKDNCGSIYIQFWAVQIRSVYRKIQTKTNFSSALVRSHWTNNNNHNKTPSVFWKVKILETDKLGFKTLSVAQWQHKTYHICLTTSLYIFCLSKVSRIYQA